MRFNRGELSDRLSPATMKQRGRQGPSLLLR